MRNGGWIFVQCEACGEELQARTEPTDSEPLERAALALSLHMTVRYPAVATSWQLEMVASREGCGRRPS
jgi:hypothetical protein